MNRMRMISFVGLLVITCLISRDQIWASNNTVSGMATSAPVHLAENVVAIPGTELVVPISVPTDVTGLGILAYQFVVEFDASVLQARTTSQVGTLSGSWDVVSNPNTEGKIHVASYGTAPLAGSGVLLNLVFDVVGVADSTTALTFSTEQFNEGLPTFEAHNGSVVVVAMPIADFIGTPTSGYRPLTVQYTDISTHTVTSRTWEFGDGDTSTQVNPLHEYKTSGIYSVTLTVAGPGGNNTRKKVNYIVVTEPVVIANAGGAYSVDEGSSVALTGAGTDPSGVHGPLTYAWDLDNNGSFETSGQSPTFSANGLDGPATVTAHLRVTNRIGGSAIDSATITIRNVAPTALDDIWTTDEDTILMVPAPGVLGNDFDPGGDALVVINDTFFSNHGAVVDIKASGASDLTFVTQPLYRR